MAVNSSKKTVMLALSGGVDSTVCAQILKQQGYDIKAVVMQMSDAHGDTVKAAADAAEALSIPLTVLDLRQEFSQKVIAPFISDYQNARTPNPCVICNPLVKFYHLLKSANEQGCEKIATGHYAKIGFEGGRYFVKKADSEARDQSYMLYRLSQEVLSRLIMPLGTLDKDEVRQTARLNSFAAADAPDSQENCFIPDNDYAAYIKAKGIVCKEGNFISPDGKICGKHKGIIHYTVGQRKGLGIALGKPVFIKKIDAATNDIFLAFSGGQFKDEIVVKDCVFMLKEKLSKTESVKVKIRSAARAEDAVITPLENNTVSVKFKNPVSAPAPGQSAVFYVNDAVLGGGFIV